MPELLTVDLVTIPEEIRWRGVVREGVHDLLGGPGGGGVLGHVEVDDAPAVVSEHDENKEDAQTRGWHGEEIYRDEVLDMMFRNVRQVCDGGERRFGSRRETVRSATSRPSFRSSHGFVGRPRADSPRPFASPEL